MSDPLSAAPAAAGLVAAPACVLDADRQLVETWAATQGSPLTRASYLHCCKEKRGRGRQGL